MHLSRRLRLLTVILSLWALAMSQLAVAAYACPRGVESLQASVAPMPHGSAHCDLAQDQPMDDAQPALCQAHCHPSPASADHFQLPTLATLEQMGVVLTVLLPLASTMGVVAPQLPHLLRDTGQSLAIQHCCFRI